MDYHDFNLIFKGILTAFVDNFFERLPAEVRMYYGGMTEEAKMNYKADQLNGGKYSLYVYGRDVSFSDFSNLIQSFFLIVKTKSKQKDDFDSVDS